jgi:hypothetical protein
MWRRIRFKTLQKVGISPTYQLEPKWLHPIMVCKNNAKRIQDTTVKLKLSGKA